MKIEIDIANKYLPSSALTLRPLLFRDGNSYCCVLGPDPQAGVFGCGETPEAALLNWDKRIQDRMVDHPESDEVARYIEDKLKALMKKPGTI